MRKILLIAVIIVFAASFAYAECKMCSNLRSNNVTKVWGARLCSGLCNTALGWSEIFFRPGKVVAEGGNGVVGLMRGLGNAVGRTIGGAVEVVTFWVPGDAVVLVEDCPICAYK